MTQFIKSKRVLNGLKQEDVSNILNISLTAYRKKEVGKVEFKVSELKKLITLFHLTEKEVYDNFLS